MTPRQRAIRDLEIVRPHVAWRANDAESAPQWREHLYRNDRKLRWLRYLESR